MELFGFRAAPGSARMAVNPVQLPSRVADDPASEHLTIAAEHVHAAVVRRFR